MRSLLFGALAVLAACGGSKAEVDSTKVKSLIADTTAALGQTPVDTTGRRVTRPAVVDYSTDAQKALRNKKVAPPPRVVRKLP